MNVLSKSALIFNKYPVLRGMASYAVMWPISSLIQQSFEGKRFNSENNYEWWKCARYALFGSCYVAPTLYGWMTFASMMWPGNTIRTAIVKTVFETIIYGPFANCSFFFFMSLLESKTVDEAVQEVRTKFWPTIKVAASFWPAIAMTNYYLIPPKNRVPFISTCSIIWTCYLAYMKQLDAEKVSHKSQEKFQVLKRLN